MKKSVLFSAIAAIALSTSAFAGSPDQLSVDEIASITGMERNAVLLMVGPKSNNPLYRTAEISISRQWKAAVAEHGLLVEQVRDRNGKLSLVVRRSADDKA